MEMEMKMEPPNELDLLLDWLHEDRNEAGKIYVKLLKRVEFTFDRFENPEGLAYEVIDRVCKKLQAGEVDKTGNPLSYISGVVRYLKMEKNRDKRVFLSFDPEIEIKQLGPDKVDEEKFEKCCNAAKVCIKEAGEDGEIFMKYYLCEESADTFDCRKRLADENGISVQTLRVKVFRTRAKLKECVENKIN